MSLKLSPTGPELVEQQVCRATSPCSNGSRKDCSRAHMPLLREMIFLGLGSDVDNNSCQSARRQSFQMSNTSSLPRKINVRSQWSGHPLSPSSRNHPEQGLRQLEHTYEFAPGPSKLIFHDSLPGTTCGLPFDTHCVDLMHVHLGVDLP